MNSRKRIPFATVLVLAALLPSLAGGIPAQESSSNPLEQAASPNGPTAALRDVLTAACSQSQNDFERFLTMRNKEAFLRMTPAARVAFMKRFVLLNEPGKPSVTTNPSGRPIVRCDTPAGAAEIQIGGADTRDNVSFLPVKLRDATDTSGADAIQVNMGLVRESGQWKILSLGLVLLDLPSLEFEWDSAEADKNEQAAIESLKNIAEAVETYRRKYAAAARFSLESGASLAWSSERRIRGTRGFRPVRRREKRLLVPLRHCGRQYFGRSCQV